MQLFDAHCHLQDERIVNDAAGIMARAAQAGVKRFACCGSSESDWPAVERLSTQFPELVPSFGVHPWYVAQGSQGWTATLRSCLERMPQAGVGEIGLDHAPEKRNDRLQTDFFLTQLRLAVELQRPASIHCRRAWPAMLETLRKIGRLPAGFVIHSYSGTPNLIKPLLELGAYFSYSGSITRPGNRKGVETVKAVPLDRLLIETDAPDIPPFISDRDHPADTGPILNEPANLVHVLRRVAELRGMTEQELALHTWENACRLFRC